MWIFQGFQYKLLLNSDSLCAISSNRNLKDTWFFFFGNRSLLKVLRVLLTPSTTSLQLSENPYCALLISPPQNQSAISLHHRLFIQQDFSFQNKVRKVLLWELRLRNKDSKAAHILTTLCRQDQPWSLPGTVQDPSPCSLCINSL